MNIRLLRQVKFGTLLCLLAIILCCQGERIENKHGGFSICSASREQLIELLGRCRPTEARYFGNRLYEKWNPSLPFCDANALRQGITKISSALGVADEGFIALVDGRLDRAILKLEEASAEAPPNYCVLTDLAAAYLARSNQANHRSDLLRALWSAGEALRKAPNLPEARFNRALALERLFLTRRAQKAWEFYLRLPREKGWSSEALYRLANLRRDLAQGGLGKEAVGSLQAAVASGNTLEISRIIRRQPHL